PDGLSRYRWLALNVRTPAARLRMVSAEPSPQAIGRASGRGRAVSLKEPETLVLSFSLIVPGLGVSVTLAGTALLTTTEAEPLPLSPSLSVTVALTEKLPWGWPARLSRYRWLALNVSTPAPSWSTVLAEPSPQ